MEEGSGDSLGNSFDHPSNESDIMEDEAAAEESFDRASTEASSMGDPLEDREEIFVQSLECDEDEGLGPDGLPGADLEQDDGRMASTR